MDFVDFVCGVQLCERWRLSLYCFSLSAVHCRRCSKQLLTTELAEMVSAVPERTEKSNDFSILLLLIILSSLYDMGKEHRNSGGGGGGTISAAWLIVPTNNTTTVRLKPRAHGTIATATTASGVFICTA